MSRKRPRDNGDDEEPGEKRWAGRARTRCCSGTVCAMRFRGGRRARSPLDGRRRRRPWQAVGVQAGPGVQACPLPGCAPATFLPAPSVPACLPAAALQTAAGRGAQAPGGGAAPPAHVVGARQAAGAGQGQPGARGHRRDWQRQDHAGAGTRRAEKAAGSAGSSGGRARADAHRRAQCAPSAWAGGVPPRPPLRRSRASCTTRAWLTAG